MATDKPQTMQGMYRIDGRIVHKMHDGIFDVMHSETLDAALDAIAQQIRELVGAHQSAVSFIPDGDFTRACHATAFSEKYKQYRTYDVMPTGNGIWSRIFETGEPMRLTEADIHAHPRFKHFSDLKDARGLEHPPLPGWLAVPVKRPNGQPIGLLQLSDRFEGDFDEDDQRMLEQLASLASAAFEAEYTRAELARLNKELDEFAYIASHDLRAPLRDIANLASWVIEDVGDALPEASKRHLETMVGRVGRMDALLDELLAYSRAGRAVEPAEHVNVLALLHELVDIIHIPDGFEVVLPTELAPIVAPHLSLTRVLQNLLENAIKHHGGNKGTIRVEARLIPRFVEFAVVDDGQGIAADEQERVFNMFHKLAPRDQVEGSGIGLAIVQKLVRAHGGAISLRSAPSKGAAFIFTWPCTVAADGKQAERDEDDK